MTWSKDKVQGVYINRVPTTAVVRWNADVDESGKVHRLERVHTAGDSVTERVLITLANDSATIQRQAGDSTTTRRFAAAAVAVPRHPSTDAGLLELQTRQLVARGMNEVMGESFSTNDTMVTYDTTRRVAP